MSKKVAKKVSKNDINEDLEIKDVAYSYSYSNYFLLFTLIALFTLTFFSCLYYVSEYYKGRKELQNNQETIEINYGNGQALITNNGDINYKVDNQSEEKEITIEKVSTISITTDDNTDTLGKVIFNVKYDILENTFPNNMVSKVDSPLLVRFAYSFDNKNWTYINNTISTNISAINPMVGNYYDVAGIVSPLNVQTGYELSSVPGETKKMYWKSETIISDLDYNIDKLIKADFRIEYQGK